MPHSYLRSDVDLMVQVIQKPWFDRESSDGSYSLKHLIIVDVSSCPPCTGYTKYLCKASKYGRTRIGLQAAQISACVQIADGKLQGIRQLCRGQGCDKYLPIHVSYQSSGYKESRQYPRYRQDSSCEPGKLTYAMSAKILEQGNLTY